MMVGASNNLAFALKAFAAPKRFSRLVDFFDWVSNPLKLADESDQISNLCLINRLV